MTDELWPAPDPATGDGSDFAESEALDGTPGAVGSEMTLRAHYAATRSTVEGDDTRLDAKAAWGRFKVSLSGKADGLPSPLRKATLKLVGVGPWVSYPSPNYSSRKGAKPRLLILHSAEGARTTKELGNFFARSSANASSHAGADDTSIARYVPCQYSAWTARDANPVAVQLELCGFAAWTTAQWKAHPGMLENAAQWLAAESVEHGIPLVKLTDAETVKGSGVCMHINITRGWRIGSHVDCGQSFPIDDVIARARQIVGGTDDEEWLTVDVQNPYANGGKGGTEDAGVAIGFMEQRIREGIKADLPDLVAAAVKAALADSFQKIPAATTTALLSAPVDDVATWDAPTQSVVQKPTTLLYLLKRAAEASPLRHFVMDKTASK